MSATVAAGGSRCQHLPGHPGKPGLVLLVLGPQTLLVHDLHALFAGRQREADGPQRRRQIRDRRRHQAARPGERRGIFQDQGGIHQHGPVIADQRRCLDDRVDGTKAIPTAEHRDRLMFERQAQQLQRDRHPPHVG
jgi:hypothetical protein